jgi:diacylglycerol kinase
MQARTSDPQQDRTDPAPVRGRQHGVGLGAGFQYAWDGFAHVVRTQRNMRIHLAIGALVLVAGILLHLAVVEWAILLLCIMAVLVAEMSNTLIEALVDLVSPGYHPLAKLAKDVAAGAVLVTAIGSAGIGFVILGPHLLHLAGH